MKLRALVALCTVLALTCFMAFGMGSLAGTAAAHGKLERAYVCPCGSDTSGTGSKHKPYRTINHALGAVETGGAVILEPGIYTEMVTITRRVTLESQSGNPASAVIDGTGQNHGILVQGKWAAGTVIKDLTVQKATQEGLLIVSTRHITVEHTVVTLNAQVGATPTNNPDFEALHLMGTSDSLIQNNRVVNNLDGGIYLTNETGDATDNVVRNNVVVHNAVDCGITLAAHVPGGKGVSDNLIEHNVSIGNGAAGVIIATPVQHGIARHNRVLNNVLEQNGAAGAAIHGHDLYQDVNGNVISGNFISDNGSDLGPNQPTTGITVVQTDDPAAAPIKDTVITGNTIYHEDWGITLYHATDTVIKHNHNHATVPVNIIP